jgi:hypothetical protein
MLQIAAGGDVSKPDFICQSGDELVAAGGKGGGDTAVASGETGENQETTVGERLLPVGRKAHVLKTAGGTDNDGLASAQKDAETFLFHRRMKTADNAAPIVAPLGGLVVSAQDGIARTAGRAKKPGFLQREQIQIANGA